MESIWVDANGSKSSLNRNGVNLLYRDYDIVYLNIIEQVFDGDVLNILLLISESFIKRAYQIFNPRNAMYINRADGLLNKAVMVQRDTVINSNTLVHLTMNDYSEEDMEKMNRLFEKNNFVKLLKGF